MTRAVAYFGTYDPAYPRNAVLIEGLRHRGVTVHEFQAPLPSLTGGADGDAGAAPRGSPQAWPRRTCACWRSTSGT